MTMLQDTGAPVRPVGHVGQAPAAVIRRRRVVLALSAIALVTVATAIGTGSAAAWAVLAAVLLAAGVYAGVLRRSRRLAFERDLDALLAESLASFDDFSDITELSAKAAAAAPDPLLLPSTPVPAWRRAAGLVRFIVSCVLGWALAPLVFALTVLVGGTPKDTTGKRWLANLQSAQLRLKEQSRRGLLVAGATAGVTAVGTAVVFGGAGAATAAPIVASAGVSVPAVSTSATSAGSSYTVVTGDTLSSVAARYGTTYEALASANHLSNPNLIFPGEVLTIPGDGSASATTASTGGSGDGTYTVVAGDTLSAIAARYGTTYEALAALNDLSDPNVLQVGQVLRVDADTAAATSATATSESTSSSAAPAEVTGESSAAKIAVETALAQVGKPYVWGGAGPDDFDCSGLVMYAWKAAGVDLPHYTVSQYDDTERITESELEPGDLVFYDTGDGAQPGHVTMYIGDGRVVSANEPGTNVQVQSITWDGTPMAFGRVK